MIKCNSLILLIFLLVSVCKAQTIDQIIQQSDLQGANIGISVRSMSDGDEIYSNQSQSHFVPASSLKVIPCLLAIQDKGPDYTYKTDIGYIGTVSHGILDGNLVIEASGDPTLGSPFFDQSPDNVLQSITEAIKGQGITAVEGQVIVKIPGKYKDPIASTWQWDDLTNYYAAGDWGLNINANEYDIQFSVSGSVGSKATIDHISPRIAYLKASSEVVIGKSGSGDQSYIYGDPYGVERTVKGSLPQGNSYTIRGAIPDPPRYFSEELIKHLQESNVVVENKRIDKDTAINYILRIQSPPLKEIIKYGLAKSDNLIAEAAANLLQENDNKDKTKERLINLGIKDAEGSIIKDGCGLSARNLVSPTLLTDFLYKIEQKGNKSQFVSTYLPRAGHEGTVKSLLKGKQVYAWIKSGYMGGVLSYTGILKTKSGKWLSFSVISNGHTGSYARTKSLLTKIIEAIHKM